MKGVRGQGGEGSRGTGWCRESGDRVVKGVGRDLSDRS